MSKIRYHSFVATPHFISESKIKQPALGSLDKTELARLCKDLFAKVREMEGLLEVISKGKYVWEATFDAIAEPVMIVKNNYEVERANLQTARIAETEITKVPGRKCHEIFAGRRTPCECCPLSKAARKGYPSSAQLGNKIGQKDFMAHAYPLVNEKGEQESTVMYYRDLTEELRLKEEVIQQEKMAAIGILAGGVAHEVNNPLGGVLAFTQLLLQKTEPQSETHQDLKEVEQAAVRCKKIVQELLDFSRVSKEREICPVQVNTLIEKVLPFVQMELRSLNVELQTRLDKNLPDVLAVPNRLQQVFLNLLTNACHAMPKGGVLRIKTFAEENEVGVQVQDTGVGMAPAVQKRIFEPFFTTKDPGKGTGLGLSISYRIVRELGGHIDVQSLEGKGSTLTVRLPASS
ncbi:MAG: hybrid sensor histidine kinase/response regulator [Deltaproteobacteria bacterium]|nr:hybrid sensor histidine kinase/response regulator [Deltaproteobacteria bacterium]MBI4223772.1 hybrid sensor histidine kinase/response regulator [Deltaproteobacteria bacterium]